MSDSGPTHPLRQPITPPVRKKAPFFLLPEPQIRPSDPLFPPKTTKNRPFSAHFRAFFRTTCPYSSRSSLVTRQWSAISHSANDSITRSLNHSILSAPALILPPCFFLAKVVYPSSDDGVVNGPPSSRVTRFRVALNATQTLTKAG